MKIVTMIARVLLGLMFTVFGLNGFLHFIPEPKTPMPQGAAAFAGALMAHGLVRSLTRSQASRFEMTAKFDFQSLSAGAKNTSTSRSSLMS